MEVLGQVQSLVTEHAVTIGLVLLVAVGVLWFSMSRMSSTPKSEVLVNQARVNEATTDSSQMPNQVQQEESEHQSDVMQQVEGDMQQA